MRRWVGLLVVTAVSAPALALAETGAFDDDDGTFYDLQPDNLLAAGITAGVDPANPRIYGGEQPVTRGQMAIFLSRLGGLASNPPVVDAATLQGMTAEQVAALGGGGGGGAGAPGPHGPPGPPGPPGGPGAPGAPGLLDAPGYRITKVQAGAAAQPAIAIGVDGFPIIAYRDTATHEMRVAHCGNVACTSITSRTLEVPQGASGMHQPSIAIGPEGRPYIAYIDNDVDLLYLARCVDIACTDAVIQPLGGGSLGGIGGFGGPALTIGSDGLPLVALRGAPLPVPQVRHCDNAACTSSTVTPFDVAVDPSEFDILTGSDGLGLVVYVDFGTSDMRVIKCTNPVCSTFTAPLTLDGSVDQQGTAVTLGEDGFPMISYSDGALAAIDCGTASCSSSAAHFALDGATSGRRVSTTTGVDGFVFFAHHDATGGGRLRVSRCTIDTCATVTTSTVMASAGADPSVTIGVDGMPVVAFVDGAGELSVVHFANRFGTPHTREW